MGAKEFTELCKKKVAEYYKWDNPKDSDIYVVWLNKTIQNNKAMLSTTKPDGMYFEITYNGDKQELYFDAYKRIDHYEDKVSDDYSSSLKEGLTVDEFIDQAEKFLEEDVMRDMRRLGFDYEYINLWNDEVEAAADGTIKGKFETSSPDNKPIGDYIVSYNIVDGSWNIHTMQPYDHD